ncbi:hypothetical protein DM860_008954 [Cuscuta australis]|uniref:GPI-anchored protein LLG1-like domain-containing protein n=1 Tax=Cuscuta australis TaxID=267555 RepID=A0A328D7G3_9ASTE|nr:hypothetical protein DM860_008954 [Cuscuta australis]
MENQNYTIVTSQCKGPHYDGKICCGAFKELACKNRDALNADNNNCATVLFNYLHLYGKYPAGLFGNLCKEDKNGLDCKQVDDKEAAAAAAKSGASSTTPGTKSTAAVLLVAAASFLAVNSRR